MRTPLLTAQEMRDLELAEIESGRVSGFELMERAGAGVVEAVLDMWPELIRPVGDAPRAVILCGPGNNGGDGFVIARLLREGGWGVDVFACATAPQAHDAAKARAQWEALGPVSSLEAARCAGADVVVDAVFGTGLSRAVTGGMASVLARCQDGARVVAVDLPSGLCAESGRVFSGGVAVRADLTVSFHALKRGHVLAEGGALCGHSVVVDIGLRGDVTGAARYIDAPGGTLLSKAQGHKFSHGHAVVVSGGAGRSGAARLAARAALRVGAGVVTLAVPPAARAEVAAQITALMMHEMPDADALAGILSDSRVTGLCLGPGLGRDGALVARALDWGGGTVLDADAVTLIAQDPSLRAQLHGGCVLTPHWGEFTRLCPEIADRLMAPCTQGPAYSKCDAVRDAARALNAVLLLKGADTVIAAPDGRCWVHGAVGARAVPWLATAGAGDVLAGLIVGLLARGMEVSEAACIGAWLHVECARKYGPGLIAEDLSEQIPAVLRGLGA